MKIYRLEVVGTGRGPFREDVPYPDKWKDTHFAPHDHRNTSYHTYKEWLKTHYPTNYAFPKEFHFGFVTLAHLTLAFDGWEKLEDFVLMECEIDITNKEDFLILSDGQVMYRKLLSKIDITEEFRPKSESVEEKVDPTFTFELVSPKQVRENIEKDIKRHLEGFKQYLQHQVNKGFRNALYQKDLDFKIRIDCTLLEHKHRFDDVIHIFCQEMCMKGWIVQVMTENQKYILTVSEDLPF